jgi:predicted Zn finger-like uncharacterized protein
MAIEFTCPACGATLRVDDDAAGRLFRCGSCLSALRVPEPSAPRHPPPDSPEPEDTRRHPPPGSPANGPDPGQPPRQRGPLFWLVVASGLLAGGMCACCCGFGVLAPSPKWRPHESRTGGFKVELPAEPRTDISAPGLGNADREKVVGARVWNQAVYAVGYEDIPRAGKRLPDEGYLADQVTELRTIPNIQVLRDQPITVAGFPGHEVEFVAGNGGTYVLRLVIADHRLYRLVAGGKSVRSGDENVRRFLDSFEITDPKLLAAAEERAEKRRREERSRVTRAGRAAAAAAYRSAIHEHARVAATRLLADSGLRIRRAIASVLTAVPRHAPPVVPTAPEPRPKGEPPGDPHPALTFPPPPIRDFSEVPHHFLTGCGL